MKTVRQSRAMNLLVLLTSGCLVQCSQKSLQSIDYLGQKPPGMTAELFAPGVVSTDAYEHSSPAFSPDGSVVLWTVVDQNYRASLREMTYENGQWSAPGRPSFADSTADDYYPGFSPDGKKVYFSSRRIAPSPYPGDIDIRIWEVERIGSGWGVPVPVDTLASKGHEYAHSVAKNGTLYFSSPHDDGTSLNIYRSGGAGGRLTQPVLLPYSINGPGYEDGCFIAPDESYLIFESNRPEGIMGSIDLYISFRLEDGRWSIPVNMGPEINSDKAERFARVSPDGKYLFFGSSRNQSATNIGFDIYWIDASIIDRLKSEKIASPSLPQPLGDQLFQAIYQNDVENSAELLERWLETYPGSLDASVLYSSCLRKQKRYLEADQFLTNNKSQWSHNAAIALEAALAKFGIGEKDEAKALLAHVLTESNDLRERYVYLSNALLQMGLIAESDGFFEKAMAIHSNIYEYYRRARACALVGENEKAFENLGKAVDQGYNSMSDIDGDMAFTALKADPKWKELLAKLK